jgi:hypothetical protein
MARGTIPLSVDEGPYYLDDWGDPMEGLPDSFLDQELMRPRKPKTQPFIWEGALPELKDPGILPIPNYTPPTPQEAMMGGVQGIQVPPKPPPFVQDTGEAQQKPAGWRNVVGKIGNIVGDAMAGAATPNIAGGGATDVFRAATGAAGARKSREQYEQQQRDAAERRKIEAEERKERAEDRKRKIEYDTENIKLNKERVAAQKAHYEQLKNKPVDNLEEVGGKLYDKAKGEWILPPTDVEQRDTYYTKLYEAKKRAGDADAEQFNPKSKKIRELIDYGRYGDPDDRINRYGGGKYGIVARGNPAELDRLMAFEESEHNAKIKLAEARRAQKMATGGLTTAQKLKWAADLKKENLNKRVGLDQQKQQFDRNVQAFKGRYKNKVPASGTPEREEYDREYAQILADYAQGKSLVMETYDINVETHDAIMGQAPGARGGGAPAAGGGGSGVVMVNTPDGPIPFPNQEAANKFKRDYGLK